MAGVISLLESLKTGTSSVKHLGLNVRNTCTRYTHTCKCSHVHNYTCVDYMHVYVLVVMYLVYMYTCTCSHLLKLYIHV